jgi:hypothetical protein
MREVKRSLFLPLLALFFGEKVSLRHFPWPFAAQQGAKTTKSEKKDGEKVRRFFGSMPTGERSCPPR